MPALRTSTRGAAASTATVPRDCRPPAPH
jgi:hypothetical protein